MADTELEAALAALAADDDERALDHLVAAWNACRDAAIAPLVDALASRIEPREKALGGKNANERYEAFRDVASRRRQADLARLVALLPKLAYGDVSTALDTLLYEWPYTPRMRTLLEAVRLIGYADRIAELRIAHAEPRTAELSPRARAALSELARLLCNDPAGDALLAQVYADPDADAPRLVYADWATSRGDPRGELIALQYGRLAKPPTPTAIARERALLEQYAHRWLAPIWPTIRQYSTRFERGFLTAATVEPFAVITARPEWSTVVSLELAYHEALPMEAFRALRELRNVTPALLAQVASTPRRLTHLGLAADPGRTHTPRIAELCDPRAFPELRSIGLWGRPEDWTWLWETALGKQLRAVEVSYDRGTPWFEAVPPWIAEVHVRERTNHVRIDRTSATLEIVNRERDLAAYLLEVAPATMREVRFVVGRRLRPETVEPIERVARARNPALERFTLVVDPFV